METIALICLLLSMSLIAYNYIIYPLVMITLQKTVRDSHSLLLTSSDYTPTVSFIIAAYNEERVIKNKLINTLGLYYPADKIQIIVASDGSSDSTPEIVNEFSAQGVIGLHNSERAGKSAAINRAVETATGEVLIFSDANNDYEEHAIKLLTRHFQDKNIGAVTGAKHIYDNAERESSRGDGLYWKYESRIKAAESHLGSITAAEGEILAVRASLFQPIPRGYINDDAAITFSIVQAGYRIIYDKEARAFEQASKDLIDDLHVKTRMATGGYQTIAAEWSYLIPPRNRFAVSFLSHKVLRWLTPHFMLLTLLSSFYLAYMTPVMLFLFCQLAFYALAYYGWLNRSEQYLKSVFYIPMYFTSMNLAMFAGFIKFITGKRSVNWHKAER